MDHADVSNFNASKANTSRADDEPVKIHEITDRKAIEDLDEEYYDMSKAKYLHIFNHHKFSQTREFGSAILEDRDGTDFDVDILTDTFTRLGFQVKKHQDLTYSKIKKVLEKFIKQDHSNTSCAGFAILTHGSYDGYLFAENEPYKLKDITKMLEDPKLALIPKILFIQVSKGMDVVPQPTVFRRQSSWRSTLNPFKGRKLSQTCFPFWGNNRSPTSATTHCDALAYNPACRGDRLDKGHQIKVDGIPRKLVHIPSHIDFLILHASPEEYSSFRCDEEGSWMIQSLCKIIDKYHKKYDILRLITLVNKRVAFDFTSENTDLMLYHNKKQTLEARYTLTKFLML